MDRDAKVSELPDNGIFYVDFRLRGGKGGFGSLLRAIGSQIERTTNREACRDLSGRRLRDVHNERRLKEWLAKQRAKRNTRKLELLKSKLERMRSQHEGGAVKHMLHDSAYVNQCNRILETIDAAMTDVVSTPVETEVASCSNEARKEAKRRKRSAKVDRRDSAKQLKVVKDVSSKSKRPLIANEAGWLVGSDNVDLNDLEHSDGDCKSPTMASSDDSDSDSDWSTTSSSTSESETAGPADATEAVAKEGEIVVAQETASSAKTTDEQQATQSSQNETEELGTRRSDEPVPLTGEISAPKQMDDSTVNQSNAAIDKPPESNDSKAKEPEAQVNYDPIDLDAVVDEQQLLAYGEAHLKHELARRGLKCGGTLQERGVRLFAVKGLRDDQIPQKLRARVAAIKSS